MNSLLESTLYRVDEIKSTDTENLQAACDLINEGGQLSWTLTPSRLNSKIGYGEIFGLYDDTQKLVGIIALKQMILDGMKGVESGYLYIVPEHRSLVNAAALYNNALKSARKYPFMMATCNVNNGPANTLIKWTKRMKLIFTAKSKFSSNQLNYWLLTNNNGSVDLDVVEDRLREEYDPQSLNEASIPDKEITIAWHDIDYAPSQFQSPIRELINKLSMFREEGEGSINIYFGNNPNLPTEPNTVFLGNRFYNKNAQYSKLKGIVPTIQTANSASDIEGEFIAKKVASQRQQGQLINQMPDDESDYIFQPLLDIIAEYRAIVYYMNGRYHVSGIYKKTGSNASFQSITNGPIHDELSKIAIKSTKTLQYGVGGADIALVRQTEGVENVSEAIGSVSSRLGKMAGKFAQRSVREGQALVLLECNSYPSMSNPMILHDFTQSLIRNIT